ncbi:LLM class flavin-dependent oxidoreductase [Novosphingobium sp. P6W]|uniref:LLM class flavin-dependent oxidoreductase n=1 Tax=Novosphingobium sp. P6W TaxID=1609758 RepID=UPI0005C2DCD7|nr:LLM class flavin-dependent oxidoreductase [Novosphingobium sp. P6W]AXB79265.1 LLM class flavin-dependent oxidoreductase [Novosphingobium sp. P6W]KIS31847.1 luciferase [Novosphingobium sp. P6W]
MSQSQSRPATFGLPSDTGGRDLGIFMPMANGGWILSKNAPTLDGSYDYNLKAAKLAEDIGLDFIMAMAKYRGYGGETEHWRASLDSPMMMAGLAQATSRVKVWATVHTILQNPAVTAKMIATLDQISHGRAGLNVVTGAYKGEFAQMGAWPEGVDHDERYVLATEWIQAIKALWTEPSVTSHGKYFTLDDCISDPKPASPPFLVCAGTSKVGIEFTANEMDALFLSGGNVEELAKASADAKAGAAALGAKIRTYSMMTVVFGETDAEAEETAAHFRAGFDEGALHGMMRAYGFLDSEIGKENAFTQKARSTFMTPHVLGTPETVIERLSAIFENTSLDGLMLIFPDYHASLPVFGEKVLPVLRERFPAQIAAVEAANG